MADPGDVVLAHWNDHRLQLRQSEDHRAATTNHVLVIASVLAGFVVQQRFQTRTIPLSLLVMAIGMYGAITSAKYRELANYHRAQSRALSRALQDLGSFPDTSRVLDEVRKAHRLKYPRLHRLRLRGMWIGLDLAVVLLGATFFIFAWAAA
jgi:type IV secretory pathway TrbF-like protein